MILHVLGRAPTAVGDDGLARSHRLQWRDAEILLGRVHEGPAAAHEIGHLSVRNPAGEPDVGAGPGSQPRVFRSLPHDHQRPPEPGEGLHHQVEALVRDQGAHGEVEVFPARGRCEALRRHRRYLAVIAVVLGVTVVFPGELPVRTPLPDGTSPAGATGTGSIRCSVLARIFQKTNTLVKWIRASVTNSSARYDFRVITDSVGCVAVYYASTHVCPS